MRAFLIDFENVKSAGLAGIEDLTPDDHVVILYSVNSNTISFEMHQKILMSQTPIEYFQIRRGGKNSLDFQLSSLLGWMLAGGKYSHLFIISNDNGFDALTDFWTSGFVTTDAVVRRYHTIGQALSSCRKAEKIRPEVKETVVEPAPAETVSVQADPVKPAPAEVTEKAAEEPAAPVIDPAVGAEHYVVNVKVVEGTATVTIQCDYADIYMLNGEFVFSYPTDKVELVGSKWNRGGDRVFLPSATVQVNEEAGTLTLAFMTSDGGEFQDGLVNMLDLVFQAKNVELEEFPLTMECETLRAWEDGNAVGKDMLAAGEMPTKLSWMISMEETPVQEPEQPKGLLGDVNSDEKVDSTDARITLQYAVKKITADKLDLAVADVNGDGKVDSTDARLILQYAVKKITGFSAAA